MQRDTLYNDEGKPPGAGGGVGGRVGGHPPVTRVGPRDPPRPNLVREHGAALLPAGRGGRGGAGCPDRAQPGASRRRGRPRADLVDRVRPPRAAPADPPAPLRLVRGRGRLDPARLAGAARVGSRSVAVTPESATSVVLVARLCSPRPSTCRSTRPADATLLIGDAALAERCSRIRRRTTTSADSGWSGPACRWSTRSSRAPIPARRVSSSSRTRSSSRTAERARSPSELAREASEALRLPRGLPRALLREAPLPVRAARAGRPADVLRARARRRRARARARAPLRRDRGGAA